MGAPSLCFRSLGGRRTKGGKQGVRERIRHHLPLRMPLHGKRETWRPGHAKRLDQSVGRARLHRERAAEALDPLAVEGIHANALLAGNPAQQPARLECHLVRRTVLHFERLTLIVTMVEMTRHLMDALIECSTEGDVHFLKTTTDPEHGYPHLHRLANQR